MSGFSVAPQWLIGMVSPTALNVYLVLSGYVGGLEGTAWPSLRTISKKCGRSIPTVRRALKELASVGAVTITERHGEKGQTSNAYELHITPSGTPDPPIKNDRDPLSKMTGTPYHQRHPNKNQVNKNQVRGEPPGTQPGHLAALRDDRCPAHQTIDYPPPCHACKQARLAYEAALEKQQRQEADQRRRQQQAAEQAAWDHARQNAVPPPPEAQRFRKKHHG